MLPGTIRNDYFKRNTALQPLLRLCFAWLQHCTNIATPCCAKNRRYLIEIRLGMFTMSIKRVKLGNREFKKLRRRPQRQL